MFWGISPALDLQEEYLKHNTHNRYDDINILLIGSCDARHILKTLAQAYRHANKRINIYVIEGCLELIARQLMLLAIAFENPQHLGLLEKTRLFMEIYGNTLMRQSSSKYMISKSKCLIKMITDLNYMSRIIPVISIDGLKYRERDYIEMLLQFWEAGNTNRFNICDLWDKRVRNYLGTRYDAKYGVFDWDYNMRLRDIGGATVSSQEFKHFRTNGVAFTWLETEVSRPNCTLAAGVLTTGEEFIHRGYIGDIVVGPYIAYGLSCEDDDMMKTSNKIHLKRATDISERNVMRMLYEIQHKERFDPQLANGMNVYNLGAVILKESDANLSSEDDIINNSQFNLMQDMRSIDLDFANVSFHSPSAIEKYPMKESFLKKFDLIYLSHNRVDHFNTLTVGMLKDDGIVIVESKKYLLDVKKDIIKAFADKIITSANNCGCELVTEFQPMDDSYATLKLKRIV